MDSIIQGEFGLQIEAQEIKTHSSATQNILYTFVFWLDIIHQSCR